MIEVTALGELLIDFTPCGKSPAGMRIFEQNPGGAPANVLCALSNLGIKTAFLGKVGDDMHGKFLRETLDSKGICTIGLMTDPNYFTTLAFVELSKSGERSFSFARKPGADTQLCPDELSVELLQTTKVFHFGSLSLTNEPSRSATLSAIQIAKDAGAIISYDPNYRALLWSNLAEAMSQMRSVLSSVDIIKISDEETKLLTGLESPEAASSELLTYGISCVVVTLGRNGALIRTNEELHRIKGFNCEVIDTTGAGDAFWGGFLYKLLKSKKRPHQLVRSDTIEFITFANAAASLCIQKRGAIPAMPYLDQILELSST